MRRLIAACVLLFTVNPASADAPRRFTLFTAPTLLPSASVKSDALRTYEQLTREEASNVLLPWPQIEEGAPDQTSRVTIRLAGTVENAAFRWSVFIRRGALDTATPDQIVYRARYTVCVMELIRRQAQKPFSPGGNAEEVYRDTCILAKYPVADTPAYARIYRETNSLKMWQAGTLTYSEGELLGVLYMLFRTLPPDWLYDN